MNKALLQQLYDGDIYPAENILPKDPRYKELCREIGIKADDFKERLASEERAAFEQIKEMEEQIGVLFSFENFSYGFRLGVMFMTDTFMSDDDFIHGR